MKYFRICFYSPTHLYIFLSYYVNHLYILLLFFSFFLYVVQFKKEINQRKYKIHRLLKKKCKINIGVSFLKYS